MAPQTRYDPRADGARCGECPLRASDGWPKRAVQPVWAKPNYKTIPIALIGDLPGPLEERAGRPFQGGAAAVLSKLLKGSPSPRPPRTVEAADICLVTYACLCRTVIPNEEGKKKFDPKAYIAWLRKQNLLIRKQNKANPDVPPRLEMKNPFECCAPRLERELARAEIVAYRATLVVMPAGSFALASVQGQPGHPIPIQKWRGSVITPPTAASKETP